MSKQPQLPPRCPISKTKSLDSSSSIVWNDESFHLQRQKSLSQSFGLEEQPAWLDDLLGDWDSGFELKTHLRSASDSGTVLDDVELASVNTEREDTNAATVLESACVYGPNSPRAKDKSFVQESAIVSALSEYASHGPVQYVNSDIFVSGFPQVDSVQDVAGEANMELKPFKRLGLRLLLVTHAIYSYTVLWILYHSIYIIFSIYHEYNNCMSCLSYII